MKRLIVIAVTGFFMLSVSNVIAQSCYPDYGYPPCEGNLDYDCDVDANDVVKFLGSFGRNPFLVPCPPSGPAMVEN